MYAYDWTPEQKRQWAEDCDNGRLAQRGYGYTTGLDGRVKTGLLIDRLISWFHWKRRR